MICRPPLTKPGSSRSIYVSCDGIFGILENDTFAGKNSHVSSNIPVCDRHQAMSTGLQASYGDAAGTRSWVYLRLPPSSSGSFVLSRTVDQWTYSSAAFCLRCWLLRWSFRSGGKYVLMSGGFHGDYSSVGIEYNAKKSPS